MPYHNIFIDLNYSIRNQASEFDNNSSENNFFGASLRANVPKEKICFKVDRSAFHNLTRKLHPYLGN